MNSFRVFRAFRGHLFRELTAAWLVGALLLQSAVAVAPEWWSTQNVINPLKNADDYAVANVGQLKNLAKKAALEMEENLWGGAGDPINAVIASWEDDPAEDVTRDDYAVLTLGQLKMVAAMFYDRLAAAYVRPAGSYPWTQSTHAADDFAVANVGQLKAAFGFDMIPADVNDSGIPDLWETQMFGNLTQDTDGDFDLDGMSNLAEWQAGTRADSKDSDDDGWEDGQEQRLFGNPTNASSTPMDSRWIWMSYEHAQLAASDSWSYNRISNDPQQWAFHKMWSVDGDVGSSLTFPSSKPASPTLRAYPMGTNDSPWLSTGSSWSVTDSLDDPLRPNTDFGVYVLRASDSYNDGNNASAGWNLRWKRYRIQVPEPLPFDYEENYLAFVQEWDMDAAVDDGNGGVIYPEPEIKDILPVKLTLAQGQTTGAWGYCTPRPTEGDNKIWTVKLVPIEFAVSNVPVMYAGQPSSVPPTEPLATGGTSAGTGSSGDGYDATQAVIEDKDFNKATTLKVAKLNGSVMQLGNTFMLDTAGEPDQFVVRLPGLWKPSGKMSLVIETTDPSSRHSDNATLIPLQWKGDIGKKGYMVTPRQILVAHDADDDYPSPTVKTSIVSPTESQLFGDDDTDQPDPAQPSDRTHLAALGSTIKVKEIRYKADDPTKPLVVRDPQLQLNTSAKHTVHVKAFYFPDSGVEPERIINDVQVANDIFAQVGIRIKLEPGYPKAVPLPTGETDTIVKAHEVAPPTADKKTRMPIVGTPSSKGQSLISVCDRSSTELCVIYCQQIRDDKNKPTYAGYAYPPYACAVPQLSNSALVAGYIKENDKEDDDSVITTKANGMVMVLAHEVGHLLTDEGHFGMDYPRDEKAKTKKPDEEKPLIVLNPPLINNNLMKQGRGSREPGIGATCRLHTQYQEGKIHGNAAIFETRHRDQP